MIYNNSRRGIFENYEELKKYRKKYPTPVVNESSNCIKYHFSSFGHRLEKHFAKQASSRLNWIQNFWTKDFAHTICF